MLKSSIFTVGFSALLLIVFCQKKSYDLPPTHHHLAVKLIPAKDSTASFELFELYLDRFILQKLPITSTDTPENLAENLSKVLAVMQKTLAVETPAFADSLNGIVFFMGLSNLKPSYEAEKLDGATAADYLAAYCKFWPQQVRHEKRVVENSVALFDYLDFTVRKPSAYSDEPLTPEEKAFVEIRTKLIIDEMDLTEKQMLLMKSSRTDFINSLSERQVKLYTELMEMQR